MFVDELGKRNLSCLKHFLGSARRSREHLTVSGSALAVTPAAENQKHRSTQVRRNPGVVAELGRGGHIGVIRAKDDDDIIPVLDRLVASEDPGEGGIRVGMHLVVGGTHVIRCGTGLANVIEQQVQDLIRVGARAGDGTIDPGAPASALESLQQAKRDRRLARVSFGRGDVDMLSHSLSFP
jgi:hypothetical protein